jgi:4-hydroxybenzoate polyprenyltransferase
MLKRIPVISSVLMGACRGLSVMLGAAATGTELLPDPLVLLAAGLVTAYVAGVSAIARGETRTSPPVWLRNAPTAILAFCMTMLVIQAWPLVPQEHWATAFVVLAVVAVGWSGWCSARLTGKHAPGQVQRAVGGFIRGLLLIQAALACLVAWPGMIVAGALLAAWPLNALLARRFKPS